MGADERVFAAQKEVFPDLIVPNWIDPKAGETIQDYARRFAKNVDPGVPCYIGGASFGGMVAVEMMPFLDVKGCFLIGSTRDPSGLPSVVKWMRPFAWITRLFPYCLVQLACSGFGILLGNHLPPMMRSILSQASHSDSAYFRWAVAALLSWQSDHKLRDDAKIKQIHGAKDPLLPIHRQSPDQIIPKGAHVISMSYPREVNEFLESGLESCQ